MAAQPISDPYAATAIKGGSDPYAATAIGASTPTSSIAPQGIMQRTLGVHPVDDTLSSIGAHLKNLVSGPYHAFTDDPRNPEEQQIKGTSPDSGTAANMLGQFGLGAARMLVQPTRNALRDSSELRRLGGPQSSLLAPSSYDSQGNNIPTAGSKIIDALPVVGPWSRAYADEVHQKGFLPASAGLATDALAPEAAGGILRGLKPISKSIAIGDVTNMIKPSATDTAFGKAPAEGLLKQPGGIFSGSKERLLDRSKKNIGLIGQQIGNEVANAPQTPMNVSGEVINPYAIALKDAAKNNNTGLVSRLQETSKGLTNNMIYSPTTESIIDAGPKDLKAITPSEVFNLKRRIGDNTKWTNQAFDNDLNATQGQVYGGIKEALNNAIPALKPLNETYGDLRAGVSALERRLPIEARNNAISLPDATLGAGAAAAGGLPYAATSLLAKKLVNSTPLRTGIDAGLYRFGTAPVRRSMFPGLALSSAATRSQD